MPNIDELELEINPNDASCDTRQIPKNKDLFKRSIAGLLVGLTLFSGSVLGPTVAHAAEIGNPPSQSQGIDDENRVINIPEEHAWEVADLCGKEVGEPITIKDLKSVKDSYVSITAVDGCNLEWIKYLGDVEYLSIILRSENTEMFRQIDSLSGVRNLALTSIYENHELNATDFAFLKNSPKLTGLSISGLNVPPGVVEELKNIRDLSLYLGENIDIDFSQLTHLDSLDFSISGPYDIAIDFTKEEYDILKKAGVKIEFHSDEYEQMYLKICEKLDEIVSSLPVDKMSSDQEKLDAILVYVLENLEYDEVVSQLLIAGQETNDVSKTFYINGALYGALEKDSAICGNYAALTGALAERLELESYYAVSEDHAWNIIEIDGVQYYVDATWLDGKSLYETKTESGITEDGRQYFQTTYTPIPSEQAIRDGRQDELEWYMEDPTNYPDSNDHPESHEIENLPSYIKLVPIKTEEKEPEVTVSPTENQDIEETKPTENQDVAETKPNVDVPVDETEPIKLTEDDKVELHVGDKKWIVPAAVGIGVLAGLGGVIAVKKKKEKEEARRRRMRQTDLDSMFSPYGTTTSYGGYQDYSDPFSDDFFEQPTSNRNKKSGRKRGKY